MMNLESVATIGAAITALVAAIWASFLLFAPNPTTPHTLPSPATVRICEAHRANVAVAALSGARDLTVTIHEALGLDLATYPFSDLRELVNGDSQTIEDMVAIALEAFMREIDRPGVAGRTKRANDWWQYNMEQGRQSQKDEDDRQNAVYAVWRTKERALRLSAMVFTDPAARVEYLRIVWPVLEEAASSCKTKHGRECHLKAKTDLLNQWCRSRGFPEP